MEKIKVNNLCYETDNNKILHNVNLSVRENQFVGIIGPNGSGKTSLLKHIYRVLPIQKGEVLIDNKDISKMNFRESSRLITVLKQDSLLAFDYTNIEMVLMGRMPHKKFYQGKNANDIEIAERALDYVGMLNYKDRLFSTLSGGEKQRVLMARSLAQDTDIYILDEPTNHLDVYYQWHLMKLIKKLNKTVLAVFHDLSIALEYCNYLYVINNGEIVAQGKSDEILTKKLLNEVFGVDGEVVVTSNGKKRIAINNSI